MDTLEKDIENILSSSSQTGDTVELKQNLEYYKQLFNQFITEKAPVEWEKISSPDDRIIQYLNELEYEFSEEQIKNSLEKLVVVKLNGGLGTTMGCSGPKSLISVRDNKTFLDLTIDQLENINKRYNIQIPLVLMNSFNTDKDTKEAIIKYRHYTTPVFTFKQDQCPRINRDSMRPVQVLIGNDKHEGWYPPGHGNFYNSFYNSGLIDQFIEQKKDIVFVSNIDNLGATIDYSILNQMVDQKNPLDFIIEVTDKTKADIKGGTIVTYEGQTRLLELAQVPKNHIEDFKSVSKFKIFNTNNIWINMKCIKQLITSNQMKLDIMENHKTLGNGINVIQLETAIGAAIKNFKNSMGINVPRYRFLPVKNNSDLFLIKSNLYILNEGKLIMNPKRQFATTPYVSFTGEGFVKVSEFLQRIPNIPDILELDHLTVSGDVIFGSNVTLKGTVIIIAQHTNHIDIPSGSVFENKIVAGNLRILSH